MVRFFHPYFQILYSGIVERIDSRFQSWVNRMRLFGWRRAADRALEEKRQAWDAAWRSALDRRDETALQTLERELAARRAAGADVEIEEEMVEGARRRLTLEREIESAGLPVFETSHRVVAGDTCHFSAPASLLDDPAQPSGRLLLTASRIIFVGGPKLLQAPWHSVRDAHDRERDIVLVRGEEILRFRCNTYGDALSGAAIARRLVPRRI